MEKQIFEGTATPITENGKSIIAVWTDGIALRYDMYPHAAFELEVGKVYRVTVEEVEP